MALWARLLRKPCRGEDREWHQNPGTCPLQPPASWDEEEHGQSTFSFSALRCPLLLSPSSAPSSFPQLWDQNL